VRPAAGSTALEVLVLRKACFSHPKATRSLEVSAPILVYTRGEPVRCKAGVFAGIMTLGRLGCTCPPPRARDLAQRPRAQRCTATQASPVRR